MTAPPTAAGPTRTFVVADRSDPYRPVTRAVTVPAACPTCGALLPEPVLVEVHDHQSQQTLTISVLCPDARRRPAAGKWCGHPVLHRDILDSAPKPEEPHAP